MNKTIVLLLLFQVITLAGVAQSVSGVIKDEQGETVPGVTIRVLGTRSGAVTNLEGKFALSSLKLGKCQLEISAIGFETQIQEVVIKPAQDVKIDVRLAVSSTSLEEVTVFGKSEITEIKQQSFLVAAIDVEPLKAQNLDVNQILSTVSGVRIREDGGMGSSFNFSLNGFSGKQIKFFLDEIPMDYFGSSMTLNNIPVNLITKIEVYKGVVPIQLGSDALGGAVNIITNQNIEDYLNVSYSFGSFNSHRAAVSSRITTKNDFIVDVNGFFNYSDNSYSVTAEVVDTETGKVTVRDVDRFHDGYQSQAIQVEAGVRNKKYADRLTLGVIASGNYNEIQTGYTLTRVVGDAFSTGKSIIPTFKYFKNDLFIDGLDVRVNATYKHGVEARIDTSSRTYNWLGEYSVKGLDVRSGEIGWDKTEFRFNDDAAIASTFIKYRLSENQLLFFNDNYSYYRRVGDDPISYNPVPFSEPNILRRNITGLSYSISLLDDKLRSSVFGKMFHMDALTKTADDINEDELVSISKVNNYYGYGFTSTYFLLDDVQIKASYESTYRLPEAEEMFGNGLQVLSNPTLKPEESQNFNISLLGNKIFDNHQVGIELGYLYRLPKNLIRAAALGNTSTYENLPSAKVQVIEAAVNYNYDRLLAFQISAAYQDMVNNQRNDPQSGGINYLYNVRIPNVPFLFGNASLGLTFSDIGIDNSRLSFNWSTLFVEAFYLKWPNYGATEDKYDIPRQVSHNFNITYSVQDGKYNVSLACNNLFDEKLFDNFLLQKPGRAFNLKLSYFLK